MFSYPKVNLALDILSKDFSGYHEIQTVFHQLAEPFDEIVFENIEKDSIEITCDNPKVPLDETNTVLKAALLLKKHFGIKKGAKIHIVKRIPLMSGLGGGSSNAVAAFKGLAKLWGVPCVKELADQIGMDCAFFWDGGTALGEHFGEKITPLPNLPPSIKFEVIETGVEVSSYLAYQQIDLKSCGKNTAKTQKLITLLRAQNSPAGEFCALLHNDFEEFAFKKYPELLKKKLQIESQKGGRVLLCGSGGALVLSSSS